MMFGNSLSLVNAWATYSIQVVFASAITLAICALLQGPRIRARIWGWLLFLMTATWIYVCASLMRSKVVMSWYRDAGGVGPYALRQSWTVDRSWAPHIDGMIAWVGQVYLLIVVFLLFQMLLKSVRLTMVLRTCRPPSPELQALFQNMRDEMKVADCTLALVPELRSPATCGFWRAHILLPCGLVPQLSPGQFSDVLRHELTHVRRRDYLQDRLAAIACRLVWFHPAVWFAHRRLRWERELACDQTVTGNGVEERLQYAESLTKLARWSYLADANPPSGVGFCSSPSRLGARVKTLLNEPQFYSPVRHVVGVCLIASLGAIGSYFLPGISLTLRWRPTPTSVAPRSQIALRERKRKPARHFSAAGRKRALLAALELPLEPAMSEKKLVNLLPASAPPPIPILDISPEAAVEETSSEDNSAESVVANPVWDEVQLPSDTNTPTWRKLVFSAIAASLGAATDEDSDKSIPRPRGRVSHPR